MKHIFKYCAVLCAAFGILTLAGCQNPIDLFQPKSETGVRITINSGGERTLYPSDSPVFSRYELDFTKDLEIKRYSMRGSESSVTITDLASGEWTVRVTGYMTITATEYAIAEGTRNITVTDGKFENVTIIISSTPVQEGPPGFFSFSVSYPDSVNDVQLFIHNIGEKYTTSIYDWSSQKDPQSSIYWYISSGYYMMTLLMNVFNNGSLYRTVAWTEVIHISPGRETRAQRDFTDDDLTRFITIGGPVDVRVGSDPVDFTHIDVYSDSARAILIGSLLVSKGDPNWQLSLPVFEAPIDLFISIEADYKDIKFYYDSTITVENANTSYTIAASFQKTSISGSADVRINGVPVSEVHVVAYNTSDIQIGTTIVSNGSWQMELDSGYIGNNVSFKVRAIDAAKGYNFLYNTGTSIMLQYENTTPIAIVVNIPTINLKGTIGLTVNGTRPNQAKIEVYRTVTVNPANPTDVISRTDWVATSAIFSNNNFAWELTPSIPDSFIGVDLHFFIEGYDQQGREYSNYYGAIKLPPNDTFMDLGNFPIVIN